jgi:hypothetical protein
MLLERSGYRSQFPRYGKSEAEPKSPEKCCSLWFFAPLESEMQLKTLKSCALAGVAVVALSGSVIAAELAKPQTASERYYAKKNIAQDSDNGALPPREDALTPEPDTADAVRNPTRTLQSLPVKSRDGQAIGFVERVDVASNGRARALRVSVGGTLVSLRADQVLYDPNKHTAVTTQSRDAILANANGEGTTGSLEPKLY